MASCNIGIIKVIVTVTESLYTDHAFCLITLRRAQANLWGCSSTRASYATGEERAPPPLSTNTSNRSSEKLKCVGMIFRVGGCHATIGPPKISPPGLVKAALYGPPGPLETLQLVPPGQPRAPRLVPLCYKWSPTLNMIQARQATRPDQFLRTACF